MRALLAFVCLSLSPLAYSADRFYGEIHGGLGNIRQSDLSFRPVEAYVSVGGYFINNVGIDLTLGTALLDDDDDGFDAQVEDIASLSVRFDSPPIDYTSAFVLIGYSQFTVQQEAVNPLGVTSTVSETFRGGTLALGLRQQLGNTPFSIVGMFRTHILDEPVDVDSYTVGVRAAW